MILAAWTFAAQVIDSSYLVAHLILQDILLFSRFVLLVPSSRLIASGLQTTLMMGLVVNNTVPLLRPGNTVADIHVSRVHAEAIIACMKHPFILLKRPVGIFEYDAICRKLLTSIRDGRLARMVTMRAEPRPALIGSSYFDLLP